MDKRVGVIGCGMMGRNHVRVYQDLPFAELVSVCDPDYSLVEPFVDKYNISYYSKYEAMIKECKLDAVSIVVPTRLHFDIAKYCLENGVDVLLEKPITNTLYEAKELIKIAKENNRVLSIGHIERYNPAVIELKKRLKNKQLGKIYKIDIDRVGPYPARIRDVGVVIDLAVHDLDIINYLINSLPIKINSSTYKHINTNNEDLVDATLTYENGVIGHININWLTPTKIRQVKVTGELGMFVLNYIEQSLTLYKNGTCEVGLRPETITEGEIIKLQINKEEPLKIELESFLKQTNIVSGEDGMEALRQALELIK